MSFDREIFDEARREFLSHLRYAKGHRPTTCYAYNSDLGLWRDWLQQAGKDWQRARAADVEQFAAWQLRERQVSAAIVNRRLSTLSQLLQVGDEARDRRGRPGLPGRQAQAPAADSGLAGEGGAGPAGSDHQGPAATSRSTSSATTRSG